MRAYEQFHVVGFEETNLTGNVYFVNHLRWQGRVREIFLREHAPSVLEDLGNGFAMVTTRCSCEYLAELNALDRIRIRMQLAEIIQNRVTMRFEYWRCLPEGDQLAAKGEQQIACMKRIEKVLSPTPIPAALRRALELFAG
jgi:enediyne biosynthesis thioesterase